MDKLELMTFRFDGEADGSLDTLHIDSQGVIWVKSGSDKRRVTKVIIHRINGEHQ